MTPERIRELVAIARESQQRAKRAFASFNMKPPYDVEAQSVIDAVELLLPIVEELPKAIDEDRIDDLWPLAERARKALS